MIKLNGISKAYNNIAVLKDITLSFKNHERYCIMGRSGVGKTTLLNVLLGLVKPDFGTVDTDKSIFSCLFQENRLINELNAIKNIELVCKPENLLYHANKLCLSKEDMNKPVWELSGGQKRRAALLRAMLAKSDAVILDEACIGLDEDTRLAALSYISENLNNRTLIAVSHDERDADLLSAAIVNL